MYQTDFEEGTVEHDEGCFVVELYEVAKRGLRSLGENPKEFTLSDMKEILKHCSDRGYIGKENIRGDYGMFVWDPEGLVNEYLSFMLFPHVRCKYVGADFAKWRSEESWGDLENVSRNLQLVLQVVTLNGGGHFRGLEHDPWRPSPGIKRIKSIRYFDFMEVG